MFKLTPDLIIGQAACVVVFNEDGHILGASVRGDLQNFGLPGGKLDPGESTVDAAARELKEETGLDIGVEYLKPLYFAYDGMGYDVQTFLCTKKISKCAIVQMEPDINVQWVTPADLINGRCGKYNNEVIHALLKKCLKIG